MTDLYFKNVISLYVFTEELEKMTKKMEEVRDAGVRVVSEDFLTDIKSSGKALQELVSLHAISPWGADVKVENQAQPMASKSGAVAAKSTGRVKEQEGRSILQLSHQVNVLWVLLPGDDSCNFIGDGKSKKMKLTVKGGAAVDPDSGNTQCSELMFFSFLMLLTNPFLGFRSGKQRSCSRAGWKDVQRHTGFGRHCQGN